MLKRPLTKDVSVCLVLAALTLVAYSGVGHFGFVQWDDMVYPRNAHLREGFTAEAVKWAFTTGEGANWHPLTWLSYLLDHQLFGPAPGPAHISNLIIHVLSSLMLFIFIRRATGSRWRSALIAFIFALHPLHVESVAWASERKDVLCALFWFLTSWAWVRYSERQTPSRYLLALIFFCLGLLSKPMIVSLPFVLLLLDFWPLQRRLSARLLLEKIPFFLLSAAASVVAYFVQRSAGATKALALIPVELRIENALITVWIYIGKTVFPAGLSFLYLYPTSLPLWQAVLAGLALFAVSVLVVLCVRRFPYLAVGWFWLLITLMPVIGLVQVGTQARADRYMYLPMVGLTIMLAWGAADIVTRWPTTRVWVASLLTVACLALIPATWIQSRTWANDIALFSHGADVSPDNNVAWHNLGEALRVVPGREHEALAAFDTEMKIRPFATTHNSRGEVLWKLGRKEEAVAEYQAANQLDPRFPQSRLNYGAALAEEGKWQAAIEQYTAGLAINPKFPQGWYNRGIALMKNDQLNEAINSFQHALELNPDYADADYAMGTAMGKQERWAEAIVQFDEVVRLSPNYADGWSSLGEALIRTGRMRDAVESLRHATALHPNDAGTHHMLAFAIASSATGPGDRSEAIAQFREAIRLDPGFADAHESLGRILAQNPATVPEAIHELEQAGRLRK